MSHEDSLNQYLNITYNTLNSKIKHKACKEFFLDLKLKKNVDEKMPVFLLLSSFFKAPTISMLESCNFA